VDAADYVVWRKGVGGASIPNRDPNNTGVIGQADYDSWRTRFGQTAGSGAGPGPASNTAVPEPSIWSIAIVGVLGMSIRRRPGRRRH
jgi:hypothetical protein